MKSLDDTLGSLDPLVRECAKLDPAAEQALAEELTRPPSRAYARRTNPRSEIMYDTGAATEADLRRLEASVTHKLDQLDANWEHRFAALESSLGRKTDDIKSHIEMWVLLPWSAAIMTMIVVAVLVTPR